MCMCMLLAWLQVEAAPTAARRRNAMADGRRLRDRRRGADRAAAAQDDSQEGSGSEEEEEAQAQVCANGGVNKVIAQQQHLLPGRA